MALDRKDTGSRIAALDAGFMAELEYEKSAQEIAIEIVNQVPSIFNDLLRRLITKAIDADRQRVKEYLDELI